MEYKTKEFIGVGKGADILQASGENNLSTD